MIDIVTIAKESGFTVVEPLDPATLEFLPEVRSMCAADRCQSYNKNWSCPPACCTLEEARERASRYDPGLLLQTVGDREDSYDFEAMMEVADQNAQHFDALIAALRSADADVFPMSAGTCTRCASCTYPDAPCRFPDKVFPSMEACGLFVSKVCKDNGVPYYYGDNKIAFTCCILYRDNG